jgi:hypothetical protein
LNPLSFWQKAAIAFFAGLFLLFPEGSLNGQASSAAEACAIGTACKAKIVLGEGYVTSTENVEAEITVLEIVRGEKAWDLVKAASPSNKPPGAGMEYIGVRIRFEFGEEGGAGDQSFGVRDEQFAAVSENGRQYERPTIVQPKPELVGRLYPGDSIEGYLVFLVSIGDGKPVMSFGNNYNRVWFRLY